VSPVSVRSSTDAPPTTNAQDHRYASAAAAPPSLLPNATEIWIAAVTKSATLGSANLDLSAGSISSAHQARAAAETSARRSGRAPGAYNAASDRRALTDDVHREKAALARQTVRPATPVWTVRAPSFPSARSTQSAAQTARVTVAAAFAPQGHVASPATARRHGRVRETDARPQHVLRTAHVPPVNNVAAVSVALQAAAAPTTPVPTASVATSS